MLKKQKILTLINTKIRVALVYNNTYMYIYCCNKILL